MVKKKKKRRSHKLVKEETVMLRIPMNLIKLIEDVQNRYLEQDIRISFVEASRQLAKLLKKERLKRKKLWDVTIEEIVKDIMKKRKKKV